MHDSCIDTISLHREYAEQNWLFYFFYKQSISKRFGWFILCALNFC